MREIKKSQGILSVLFGKVMSLLPFKKKETKSETDEAPKDEDKEATEE